MSFARALPEQLLAQGYAVVKALTGNLNFPTLPVDLNTLKTTLDTYAIYIGEAKDGGRKAILLRNQQGEEIIRMLRALATHVELNCKDDINIFLTSGFHPRSTVRATAQPLVQPTIVGVEQGVSGELLATIKAVRKARTYDLRYGVVAAAGAAPTSWSMITVANVKSALSIDGLTPGTVYALQVRAYGTLAYTAWSDSTTRMCI
jgi:hypothetical protein